MKAKSCFQAGNGISTIFNISLFRKVNKGWQVLLILSFLLAFSTEIASQNVGIGNSTPSMKLHITNSDSSVLLLHNTENLNSNIKTAMYFRIRNSYTGGIMTIGTGFNSARLGLFTQTSSSPGGLTERISITDDGHVGINTSNPAAMLDVNGNVRVSGTISNISDPVNSQDAATKAYVDLLEDQVFELQGVKDIDNNKYDIVTIGSQVWMAENLKVTRYNDGTPVTLETDASSWSTYQFPMYTWYNNDASAYGALYNYYVVADTNSHNICPAGWHVPDTTEWTTLVTYLGGGSVAGGKMKESGLAHWTLPNTDATNESGFTGLPGGYRNGSDGWFSEIDLIGFFWTSTESYSTHSYGFTMNYNNGGAYQNVPPKRRGQSVRCIKD